MRHANGLVSLSPHGRRVLCPSFKSLKEAGSVRHGFKAFRIDVNERFERIDTQVERVYHDAPRPDDVSG